MQSQNKRAVTSRLIPRRAYSLTQIVEAIKADRWDDINGEQLKGALATIADDYRRNLDSSMGTEGSVEAAEQRLQLLLEALRGPNLGRRRSARKEWESTWFPMAFEEVCAVAEAGKAAKRKGQDPASAMRLEIRRRWFDFPEREVFVDWLVKFLRPGRTKNEIRTLLSLSSRERRRAPTRRTVNIR